MWSIKWNWELTGWPAFEYERDKFLKYDGEFVYLAGAMSQKLKSLSDKDRGELVAEMLAEEAKYTSAIEGEAMNADSLHSLLAHNFKLNSAVQRASLKEKGIAEMMIALYRQIEEPLTERELLSWHRHVMNGYEKTASIGSYRDGEISVVSGAIGNETVHFVAPPARALAAEMKAYVAWFNLRAEEKSLPLLVFSGIAHLHFESLHPFSDGNGRIGRALAIKALSLGLGGFALLRLSETIYGSRSDYYGALASANRSPQIDAWLDYFCKTVVLAARKANDLLDFHVLKRKFLETRADAFNERQLKCVRRMFAEGPELFKGGMSAGKYMKITGSPIATATRDLTGLVALGALTKTGAYKSTRYHLNLGK